MTLLDWQPHLKEMMPHLLVHYPHVVDRLQETWGTSDGATYLIELLELTPQGGRMERQGFSWDAIMEIQSVMEEHEKQFPNLHVELINRKENWKMN